MRTTIFYFSCLLISLPFVILGALFKILHIYPGGMLLLIALCLILISIVIGVVEVMRNGRLSDIEKLKWICAFVFANGIAGIIYYLSFGKKSAVAGTTETEV